MKLVQLNYADIADLVDGINTAGLAHDLCGVVKDGPHMCALVRVSNPRALVLAKSHAAKAAAAYNKAKVTGQ